MYRCARVNFMFAVLAVSLAPVAELCAKGGRGGSRGGSGVKSGRAHGFKGGATVRTKRGNRTGPFEAGNKQRVRGKQRPDAGSTDRPTVGRNGKTKSTTSRLKKHERVGNKRTADNQPWSKHHAREQRKLDHRRQVANHLRELSDRNGNQQLKQVADAMEQRAQAHYAKQMDKLNQKYGLDGTDLGAQDALNTPASPAPFGDNDLADGLNRSLDDTARKLTGRENALFRQLRNEERKLAKRTEAVQRMRQLAEQIGDSDMLDEADRLEEWAMNHFDQRMTRITDFQQRHDLPDISQFPSR